MGCAGSLCASYIDVPFSTKYESSMCAGLSLYDVQLEVKAAKKQKRAAAAQRQALLFTHRGYSGPAVLDLSHHAVMALDRHTPPPGQQPPRV